VEHVVFFTGADGAAQHRRTQTLDEAVRFVEHLRNEAGVEDARVFSLVEVPLAFKAVYRVEVPGLAPAEPVAVPAVPAEAAAAAQPVEAVMAPVAVAEPVAEPVADVAPVAEVPAQAEPVAVGEPVLVAAPEPFAAEVFPAPEEQPSNGKGARGLGFFTR
jgi:hypothetical protein